jgi:hypothetical protein
VVSYAVLADERPNRRPDHYEQERWGCSLNFRYPIVKLRDWRERTSELEASANPFSIVVLAHLAAQATKRNVPERERVKLGLVRRLYERGYSRERILSLFRFIDWLLALPEDRELALRRTLRTMEEEGHMPYITSIERLSRAEGREEGIEQGRVEAEQRDILRVLAIRFGAVPDELAARMATVTGANQLAVLLERAVTARTLAEFARTLD